MRTSHSGVRRRALTALVAAAALVATMVGCTPAPAPEPTDDGPHVLRLGIPVDFAGLNPATGRADRPVRPLMYEPLVQVASDGTLAPGLALSWSASDENKVWDFELRPDVLFSDGEALTADGVVAWLQFFQATKGPFVARLGQVVSFEAVDDLTVRITLAAPNPIVPAVLAINNWGSIASPSALADPTVLDTETLGAGPYILDSSRSVTGDTYVLIPNENYYNPDAIKFDEIDVKVITNPTSMLQAIQSGQLDVAIGHPSTADAAAADLNVVQVPGYTQALIFTDLSGANGLPLNDVRVRQAMSYAVDREAIAQALTGKYGTASSELASTDGWVPDLQDHFPYDPAKAADLMKKAGVDGFTLKVLETPDRSDFTQAVASYLSKIGITLEVTTAASNSDYVRLLQEKTANAVTQDLPGDGTAWYLYLGALAPGALFNSTGWSDPDLQEIMDAGAVAEDGTKYWEEFSTYTTENALLLPVLRADVIYYVTDAVQGVEFSDRAGFPLVIDWSPAS
jgi:peptide/nickel transport system substrate-binding protein